MSNEYTGRNLADRIAALSSTDAQFAAARPNDQVGKALNNPALRLHQLIKTALTGYRDRPALGRRARSHVTDPQSERTTAELLPRFETITYGDLWARVSAAAMGLTATEHWPVRPGDRVCVLGFTGVDYTVIDLSLNLVGAVTVPLQSNAPTAQIGSIVTETAPTVFAAGIDHLTDAVNIVSKADSPRRLVVFDYLADIDDHRDAVTAATARLDRHGVSVAVLDDLIEHGTTSQGGPPPASGDEDPLTLLIYTSGSTGAPKGAMYPERLVANFWRSTPQGQGAWGRSDAAPAITLNFMPMSHIMGRAILYGTLSSGGTAYFGANSDMSTLLEDLTLVRPTQLSFVPRVWELVFQEFQKNLERRTSDGGDLSGASTAVLAQMRRDLLGGRYVSALTGSAPISPETRTFVESLLQIPLVEGYGSTEVGGVFVDGQIRRPPVIDYKLVDVPDLGYFHTDRPHPRGELLVRSENVFAGYYARPDLDADVFDQDGFYRTGDIVAEVGPDELVYLDRRNNVLKLSQGEFVAVSKVESAFASSPLIEQIYIYGNSARPYLLAVVVPTSAARSRSGGDDESLRAHIIKELQAVGRSAGLQSYEIPRDLIVETTPFTVENGLLTGIRKLARPKLKAHYAERLEQLYAHLAENQRKELQQLRAAGQERPILDTVTTAVSALLGTPADGALPDAHFTDLGGDSLSALTFANILKDVLDVDVPVGVIVSPATDLTAIAKYIDTLASGRRRPDFDTVHGPGATTAAAKDLTLDAFTDPATLAAAPALPRADTYVRSVLLTGATGFLGRFLALQWLDRMALVGGKLICLVRAATAADARRRLDDVFDSGDPTLLQHYRDLAADHLEVIAADKSEKDMGLDADTWQRLADTVDVIVDPAALVNHVLPYDQLFGPNVVGTAELIRLALTGKLKPYTYISTIAVGSQISPESFTEGSDIRVISPSRAVNDSYANGYGNSKWAGEVLLREAHDLCGLPVSVFRCDMILVDSTYSGQLNLPDMFTRLMLSLVATGVAPGSFYELDAGGRRQSAHYDGLPVDFVADAITTLAAQETFETFHVMNPHDDDIGLDQFVDWLIDAGYRIERIDDYGEWFSRFDTAIRGLPDRQRQHSLLPLLHSYQRPQVPIRGAMAAADNFRSAVQDAKIGPDKDIPHISPATITKYATDLQRLGLL